MAARRRKSARRGATSATVRRIALALPGAEEGTSYGTPAWKVKGRLFARLHQDGENLVVKVDLDERDLLTGSHPKAFHVTDHYRDHEMMLVRLAAVGEAELRERIEVSWRRSAPPRLLAAFDAQRPSR